MVRRGAASHEPWGAGEEGASTVSIISIGSSMLGMMLMMALVWSGLVLLLIWGIRHLFPHERRSAEARFSATALMGKEVSDAPDQQQYQSAPDERHHKHHAKHRAAD